MCMSVVRGPDKKAERTTGSQPIPLRPDRGQLDYAFTPYYAKSMSDFLQSVRDELSCCCWDHHHQVHEVRHPIYRFRASISADISVSSHFPQFHNEFGYLRYYVHICLQFDTHQWQYHLGDSLSRRYHHALRIQVSGEPMFEFTHYCIQWVTGRRI